MASDGANIVNKGNQGRKFSEKSIDELISKVDDVNKIEEQFNTYMKNTELCKKLAEKARFPKVLLEQLDGMLNSSAFEGLSYL